MRIRGRGLVSFVFALFFLFGGLTTLNWSLIAALIVPALCYAGIAAFGWYARRPTPDEEAAHAY
ncbi:hypothetical protein Q4F19_10040 [Sphingomonas sp. BIUV-7]|uniref:Uncharacterized protein n=1 Tax=Sphingomonas natans TaxID=3063330 RepID=A0ABT8YAH5_9SPHN|nr:hypothetical protein [Sphingomonas sp. BIUV-7]MDO6414719.1 hypothetical protein [Sphingomonas sp. BIUV-7]